MAAEQLYETLPKESRRQLRNLPDVVHRLEQDAQRMRARLEELQEALADVATPGRPIRQSRRAESHRRRSQCPSAISCSSGSRTPSRARDDPLNLLRCTQDGSVRS